MLKLVVVVILGLVIRAQCQSRTATMAKKPEGNFKVPDVPKSVKEISNWSSSFFDIWSNRLNRQNKTGPILREKDPERPEPSTLVIPTEILLSNLVPHDAPHPLYREEFPKLTDSFILDSMSLEYVDPDDIKLLNSDGVVIKTRTGKDLKFKKDTKTNTITVNGYAVKDFHKVDGKEQLYVYIIDGVLFNYRKDIDDAFQIFNQSSAPRSDLF